MKGPKLQRSPGRPKSDEQSIPVDEQILKTASQLFMELGYEPVSLIQIARLCGITKASVYYYFANKAELFTASVTMMMKMSKFHTDRILKQGGDLRSRLERIATAKMSNSHVDFETMMREASPSLSHEQLNSIRQAEHEIHEVLADYFRSAMESGEINKGNPLVVAHALSALLMIGNRDAVVGLFPKGYVPAKEIIDLFWLGVEPRVNH